MQSGEMEDLSAALLFLFLFLFLSTHTPSFSPFFPLSLSLSLSLSLPLSDCLWVGLSIHLFRSQQLLQGRGTTCTWGQGSGNPGGVVVMVTS